MKIVVANSVGVDTSGFSLLHYPSRWTTGVKRARFSWYPWQLAYLSSLLKRDTDHEVKLLDGCLRWWSWEEYYRSVVAERPDVLIMESASRTIADDLRLALAVRRACGSTFILAGQHASAYPEEMSRVADHVCIGEYEMTVLDIVRGLEPGSIAGRYPNKPRPLLDFGALPWPEDDDVSRFAYCFPGVPGVRYRQIQAYASRGCPMRCNFCVCVDLYYHGQPNWRPRDIDNVVAEVKYLRAKYPGMEGIFFDEEVHTMRKQFNIELAQALIAAGLSDLRHTAMGLYSPLDGETLEWMARAGYDQIRIGIETVDPNVAKQMGLGRKFRPEKLYEVLRAAREVGIDIYGAFTVGGLGATKESDMQTLELMEDLLAKELIWEMQVSICTPQPGTRFYKEAEAEGYLVTRDYRAYDGTCGSVLSYPGYSKEDIEAVFDRAVEVSHYHRGLLKLKREGLLKVIGLALRRRGIVGAARFAYDNWARLFRDLRGITQTRID